MLIILRILSEPGFSGFKDFQEEALTENPF